MRLDAALCTHLMPLLLYNLNNVLGILGFKVVFMELKNHTTLQKSIETGLK